MHRNAKRLLTLTTLLICLCLVGASGATTANLTDGTNNLSEGLNASMVGTDLVFDGTSFQAPWINSLASSENCPPVPLLEGVYQASSCVPRGNLCDPIYVPGAVCCPGSTCVKPYPGVPMFCL